MFFRRNRSKSGAAAVADRPTLEDSLAQIDALTRANRRQQSAHIERQLLSLRNQAGIAEIEAVPGAAEFAVPDTAALPAGERLPEFRPEQLTPGLLRAGILTHGCVLVRGLFNREQAVDFAQQIDRSFEERERQDSGHPHDDAFYSEITPDPRFGEELARAWIKEGGGVLAADAPRPSFNMFEMFDAASLADLVRGYLGETPLIACQKTTLRKAEPTVPGAWHQDGKFLGPVRALNLWVSLSRCGDESPGLDIIPRRFEEFVTTQTEEAMLDYMVSQKRAEEAAGEAGIIRPIFEPGDAIFFDELFLHKTGSDPDMPKPRFAIENWFFGASGFPSEYAPLAV